ncbi:BMP family protein [Oceanobacillus luteolus]|uniref:BMP family protein n=1 Tax=Oceanobacillus luteolus TaxID=1274358 RepID=A0ABW4HRJ0_9BACI|nr:BMP family protein [Oceanobacillus luteolus]MCM3738990.1 BMP family protein [Oceanobacillus luteolus]
MKKSKLFWITLIVGLVALLAACGSGNGDETADTDNSNANEGEDSSDFSVAMVTDIGGVDDKSFNQSAWEGISAWGEEHGLSKGNGFDYAQSNAPEDYVPNITRMVREGYSLIYGIGFELKEDIQNLANQNPDVYFGIVDDVVEGDNTVSITFKEHEGSFLVGVAAAMKTETNKLGFVGGIDSPLINKFEAGFIAGAKSINPDIEVDVQYAEHFGDASKGKMIANDMYNSGVDIIYHAAGGTGNGVFNEAKDLKNADPERAIWVIGVDRDQHDEGQIGEHNVTLTSMVKRVDVAVQDVAQLAMDGEFPGGEQLEFGLEENAISVATTNEEAMTEEIINEVKKWEESILNGDIEIPYTREALEEYLDSL